MAWFIAGGGADIRGEEEEEEEAMLKELEALLSEGLFPLVWW